MPTAELGPTGRRTAENVKELRGRMPLRELEDRLRDLGRPILPSGLLKIERGDRRVDVDDLVALAAALDVNPNRLLMPASARVDVNVEITPDFNGPVSEFVAWAWAMGQYPLRPDDALAEADEEIERFERATNPPERASGAPLMHAARGLVDLIRTMDAFTRASYGRRSTKEYRRRMQAYVDSARRSAALLLEELDAVEAEI